MLAVAFLGTASVPGVAATVSQTGVEWICANVSAQGANGMSLGIFLGRVGSSAGTVATITTAQSGGIASVAAEYSGISQTWDRLASNVGSSTTGNTGTTATTRLANELFAGAIGGRASGGVIFSAPTNSFSIVDQATTSFASTSDRGVCLLEKIVTSTGTASCSTTQTNGAWAGQMITIEESVASGPVGSLVTSPLV